MVSALLDNHITHHRRTTQHHDELHLGGDVDLRAVLNVQLLKDTIIVIHILHHGLGPTLKLAIVFTEPEIVSVGLTPDEAEEKGEEVIIGKFPLAANGRALTIEAEKTAGFIRVTARKEDHVILGIQAVGSHVAELHGEFILALEMGAQLEDISDTVHAHPTMTEAFHESVLKTLGHAIHTS